MSSQRRVAGSGAQCHAIRVRLPAQVPPDALAELLPRLWVEEVPAAAAAPTADRRRAIELARPTDDQRCVLLRYADGQADLVIVAHRGRLSPRALRRLAAAATGAAAPAPPERPRQLAPVLPDGAPDWGLGDGHSGRFATHQLALPPGADGDPASWRAALAVVLSRYDNDDTADRAVIGTDDGAVEIRVVGSLGELRAQPATPVTEQVVAGLLPDTRAAAGEVYLPCLEPPFPLTISICRSPAGGNQLRCDYWLSHFSPAIITQLARHLIHVHRQIRGTPETPVAEVALLDAADRARVAALGRPSTTLVSAPVRLDEAFARVVAATPETTALCDGDVRLTYRELDERSSRLASGLRAHGVRDGHLVGVCLGRSAELVTTLLAVLKAGAAYVPIDPDHPVDRLVYIAQDARLELMVTRLPEFPRGHGVRLVTPDALRQAAASAPPPGTTTSPDDPAYVIYTSGSTGRPKGVVVPHRNVISLLDATRDEFRLDSGDVWSLFHSSAFDFSVWESWGCLLTGGRLVVVPYPVSRDPDRFRELLVAEQVTVLSQTPSAFAALLEMAPADLAVRLVVLGGEPLDARMLLPWFDRHSEATCRVVNMFGITETTVHVTAETVTRPLALAASRSVGTALPGWHVYVMDSAGRLVPPGVAGEIYVGGAGVALRYLNQEALTAQRFLPDPFTGGRMYRSGDQGRLRPDGKLEHLGRIDNQVKVRGFRIELDEIRSVLLEDPEVRAAAVLVRRDDPADPATARIDAYVVLGDGDPASVRKRAAGMLPEHMVPATVTALETLPLTSNGKLDPGRLPAPAGSSAAGPDRPSTGDDDLAGSLLDVWSEVLGGPVGLDDDFFALGGNSLLAVRIRAAMRAGGLPSLPLRELYRHPTVRAVVAALSGAAGSKVGGQDG